MNLSDLLEKVKNFAGQVAIGATGPVGAAYQGYKALSNPSNRQSIRNSATYANNFVQAMPQAVTDASKQVFSVGPGQAVANAFPQNVNLNTAALFPGELFGNLFPGVTNTFTNAPKAIGEGLAYRFDPNVRKQYEAGNTDVLPTVTNMSGAQMAARTAQALLEVGLLGKTPVTSGFDRLGANIASRVPNIANVNPALRATVLKLAQNVPQGYAFDVAGKLGEGRTDAGVLKPGLGTALTALPALAPAGNELFASIKSDLSRLSGKTGPVDTIPERAVLGKIDYYDRGKPKSFNPVRIPEQSTQYKTPQFFEDIRSMLPKKAGLSIEDVSNKGLVPGSRVRSADRGNIGTIIHIDEKGNALVNFRNKENKTHASIRIPSEKLTLIGGRRSSPKVIAASGKERGVVESVKAAEGIAPEVKAGVQGTYTPTSNKESFAQAGESISKDFEAAVYKAKTDETIGRQANAEAVDLIGRLQSEGRMQDAIDVVENLAKRGTEAGQSIQVLAAINKLSPEGVLMWAQRNVEKAKVSNPEKFGSLRITPEKAGIIKKMAETAQTLTGDEKMKATLDLVDEIQKIVPSTWAQKLTTLWKAGLLTGVKGAVGGNAVGNTANTIMRKLSDIPAAGFDAAISTVTGNRSKVFTLKGIVSGAKEGTREGLKNFRMGVGADDLGVKMDYKKVYFDTPAIQKYVDSVFNFYSASDRPYYHSALKNSLYDLSTVAGKNQGLKGKALADFVEKTVKNPDDTLLNRAIEEAKAAVFQDKTAIGSGLSGLKQGLKKYGGSAGEIVSEGIAPFTGVPSSIANAVHRYSPTGAAQGIYKAIVASKNGNFDQIAQRNLSEALGKGLTGTAVMWLGMKLTDSGQMTLGYPTDAGERALWEREGKIPYAIKIGGKWRSLNYTGSVMSLLSIGGEISKAYESGKTGLASIGTGLLGSGKAILSSSPLQGAQAGMNAITDPQRYGDSYFRNLAASTVPTIVKDIASSGDRTDREVNTLSDAMMKRLPGARNTLLAKRDILGDEIANPAGPISSIIDPFRSSEAKSDPITDELRRLQDAGEGPTLAKPEKSMKAFGESLDLSPEELNAFVKETGVKVKVALTDMFATKEYQSLPDEDKKKLIDDTINKIRKAERERILLGGEKSATTTFNMDMEKAAFANSGKNFLRKGGYVYRKNSDGTPTVETENEYEVKLQTARLSSAKRNGDISAWMKAAEKKYAALEKRLADPNVDELDKVNIQDDMDMIAEQYAKYGAYGGFTKPKTGGKAKIATLKLSDIESYKPEKIKSIAGAMKILAPPRRKLTKLTLAKPKKLIIRKTNAPTVGKRLV